MAEVEVLKFIAKFAFGFVSDKLRDCATKYLQDGGLTDEKFKGYIIRELTEINSKLDGISRRELSASISSLQQGILHLLDVYGTAWANSTETRPAQVSVTVDNADGLAIAIGRLKTKSPDLFEKARECFKQAGIEARRAFHNTALSIKERIHANQVRMASRILEHLDHPEVAATDCLLFLEELHAMPAIQEMFSVHFKGGFKSFFKKDSRREVIKAVTMMNLNLSDFITKFTARRMAVFQWPMIYPDELVVHPIHCSEDCFNEMKKMEITPPWNFDLLQKMLERIAKLRGVHASNNGIKSTLCCVPYRDNNQRGFLKLQMPGVNDMRVLCLSPVNVDSSAHCVAVDEDDCVCVLKVSINSEFYLEFSPQVYDGDGSFVNDIRSKDFVCDHFVFPSRCGRDDVSISLNKVEKNRKTIFHARYGWEDRESFSASIRVPFVEVSFPNIMKGSEENSSVFEWSTFRRYRSSFDCQSQNPIVEIAFVYTPGNKLKGIVWLYPNYRNRPLSSPLWDRHPYLIHVMADGKTSRCLHSRSILPALISKGFSD